MLKVVVPTRAIFCQWAHAFCKTCLCRAVHSPQIYCFLNAAVEAARDGFAGTGFSVVAAKVYRLAGTYTKAPRAPLQPLKKAQLHWIIFRTGKHTGASKLLNLNWPRNFQCLMHLKPWQLNLSRGRFQKRLISRSIKILYPPFWQMWYERFPLQYSVWKDYFRTGHGLPPQFEGYDWHDCVSISWHWGASHSRNAEKIQLQNHPQKTAIWF